MAHPPRIVVFAASSALPRDEGVDQLAWEETWPCVLARCLTSEGFPVEVINCSARRRTIDALIGPDFKEHIALKRPDLVLIQLGMVDCAPRLFSQSQRKLLQNRLMPRWLRQRIIDFRSARRAEIVAKDPLRRVYTPPDRFQQVLQQFFSRLKTLPKPPHCIVLPILAYGEQMEAKSPGHAANRALYNSFLCEASKTYNADWIEPHQILDEGNEAPFVFTDGYHLNIDGSRRCAQAIVPYVIKHLRNSMQVESSLQDTR